jgi:hypothetical protein
MEREEVPMSDDAEREYVEAKAAYDAALVRLSAAKKARPKQTTKYELREAQNQRIRDAVWQAYLGGQRDYRALGKEFGRSTAWVGSRIREVMHQRRFGPETLLEYEGRKWLEDEPLRQKAERERREDFARRASLSIDPRHSEAWHQAYQMYENQRKAAEQSDE